MDSEHVDISMEPQSFRINEPGPSSEQLFQYILNENDVFYRHQQRDDPELLNEEKLEILRELYEKNPSVFITRYHKHIAAEFCSLFDSQDYITNHYIKEIRKQGDTKAQKNQRYLKLLKLREEGNYFSNEKMREREPALFDLMVGQYLDDKDKLHLRPTVERPTDSFSHMMQQFEETQQISDRRKRHLTDWARENAIRDPTDRFYTHVDRKTAETDEEFVEEFDSDDEEGIRQKAARHCAKLDNTVVMKNLGRQPIPTDPDKETFKIEYDTDDERTGKQDNAETKQEVQLKNEPIPEDPMPSYRRELLEDAFDACEVTSKKPEQRKISDKEGEISDLEEEDEGEADLDLSKEILYQEFVAHMEQRFLSGHDKDFYDYSNVEVSKEIDKIKERDLEDAYFDDD